MSWTNPEFEPHDNVGRTSEQIHCLNTGQPTWDDMLRWTESSAEEFADEIGHPDTGLHIAGWTSALSRAKKLSEFFAVSNAVLGDHPDAALTTLGEFMDAAATWCAWHNQADLAAQYRAAGERLAAVSEHLTSLLDATVPLVYDEILATERASEQQAPSGTKTPATASAPPPPAPPAPPPGRTR
ncbi:hypothetical protein [Streptomyces fragilis]|uniref:Uncharacterized protein n=1 Tax=Streptomyces fragilis TaxID=67301 RepID=A0ABV2YCB2_9ACTN|nr:hypothetical protein [Streptomyces fragilis]